MTVHGLPTLAECDYIDEIQAEARRLFKMKSHKHLTDGPFGSMRAAMDTPIGVLGCTVRKSGTVMVKEDFKHRWVTAFDLDGKPITGYELARLGMRLSPSLDPVADWLAARTRTNPIGSREGPTTGGFYTDFSAWAVQAGIPESQIPVINSFSHSLKTHGVHLIRTARGRLAPNLELLPGHPEPAPGRW